MPPRQGEITVQRGRLLLGYKKKKVELIQTLFQDSEYHLTVSPVHHPVYGVRSTETEAVC